MKLSVIIPVYNEVSSIQEIIRRVHATGLASEIIIIDDGSTDGTREQLNVLGGKNGVKVLFHECNQGKGVAVRSGISAASGDLLLIQDADLEYNPHDYAALLKPIEDGIADVVYGSRFLGNLHRPLLFWSMVANKILTLTTNFLYDNALSDMETGYKLFRRSALEGIRLRARRFDFEAEFTAKILKRKVRVCEVPVSFNPRPYSEGKKIGMKDAFEALWTLIKYRFTD